MTELNPASTEAAEETVAEKAAPVKNASIKSIADGRSDLYRLAPSKISVKAGFNSRVKDFDPADADDIALAKSIAVHGVKQPVAVFTEGSNVYLSDGHRRFGAVNYLNDVANGEAENDHEIEITADLSAIPVLVESKDGTEADRILMQITRNSGKPFTALEQAAVFKKLLDAGWTDADIATKAGFSTQRIRDLLDLNKKAPAKVKKMIQSGEVSATLAITTMKKAKGDGKKTAELLENAVSKAKSEGKKKATAKDVKVAPDNPKVKLRALFSELTFTEEGDNYTVTMSADEYATIRGLIGF